MHPGRLFPRSKDLFQTHIQTEFSIVSYLNKFMYILYNNLHCGNGVLKSCVEDNEIVINNSVTSSDHGVPDAKLIKVAVVGAPNAGKSTLINRLINRRVCAMSSKVHTTRNKTNAVLNKGNIQVIFLDSPGLVDVTNTARHNLERSFLIDPEKCVHESDLIAVVHDVSNAWTRDRLDQKVLRLLHLYKEKSSVLILNKIDVLKSKRKLLDLTQQLTGGLMNQNSEERERTQYIENHEERLKSLKLSEKTVHEIVANETGWHNFEEIFMLSASKGNGVDELKEYILHKAITRPWIYPPTVFTDQKIEEIVLLAVREKLLDNLPEEIPYNIKTIIEHVNITSAGDVIAVVLLRCAQLRHQKMLIGSGGKKITRIAKAAEKALEDTFWANVKLKLVVQTKK